MDELEDLYELKFVNFEEDGKIVGYEARPGVFTSSKVVIPSKHNGLPVIGVGGFEYNRDIEELVLPNSIKYIGERAFFNAYNLKSVKFPKRLEKIGDYAFSLCQNLKLRTLPEGIEEIGHGTLYDTAMTEFVVPSTVKKIYDEALNTDTLKVVEIPGSVNYIASNAFYKDELSGDDDLTILCHKNNENYVMNLDVFEGEDGYYPIMDQYRYHTYFIEVEEEKDFVSIEYEPVKGFGCGAKIGYINDRCIIKTKSGRYYIGSGFWAPKYRNYKS